MGLNPMVPIQVYTLFNLACCSVISGIPGPFNVFLAIPSFHTHLYHSFTIFPSYCITGHITKIAKLKYLNIHFTVARKVDQWHILLDKGTREEYIIQMRSSYTTHHPNETSDAKTLSYTT